MGYIRQGVEALGRQRLRHPARLQHCCTRRRALAVAPRAALQARGRAYSADQLAVKRVLGEGSYGQVFEVSRRPLRLPQLLLATNPSSQACLATPRSLIWHYVILQGFLEVDSESEKVVLKRVKQRVHVSAAANCCFVRVTHRGVFRVFGLKHIHQVLHLKHLISTLGPGARVRECTSKPCGWLCADAPGVDWMDHHTGWIIIIVPQDYCHQPQPLAAERGGFIRQGGLRNFVVTAFSTLPMFAS